MEQIIYPDISLPNGVVIFFSTRFGGVSDSPFHTLNLSLNVGDDESAVQENRYRIMQHLPSHPRWLKQIHGARVLRADDIQEDMDCADASYTSTRDVVCAIQTADCLPVLIYSSDGTHVAAAHAGWRGLAAGVLENTVQAIRAHCQAPLNAYIGPGISAKNYVVGRDVYEALCLDNDDIKAFSPYSTDKWHANLTLLAINRLIKLGMTGVLHYQGCTFADDKIFFSARRHHITGRQAAIIYTTQGIEKDKKD